MGTAMIWGAGGGIGRALVEELTGEGWTVIAVARHTDDLADLTAYGIEADVTDADAVQRAVATASEKVESVDLWIYVVGDITSARVSDMSADDWQRILGANLNGAYLTTHHSLPLLAKDAHLVFLGAVSERIRLPGLSAYAAAKAGLEAFAAVLDKEQRKRRVIVVRPGAVDTAIWEKVPFRVPANAMTPAAVAERIRATYDEGHTGTLDL